MTDLEEGFVAVTSTSEDSEGKPLWSGYIYYFFQDIPTMFLNCV